MSKETTSPFALLDFAPSGMCVLNSEMRIVFWNRQLARWTGLESSRAIGKKLGYVSKKLADPIYENRFRSLFEGGPPVVLSPQLHRGLLPTAPTSKRERIYNIVVAPLPMSFSNESFALLSASDVTDLTEKVQELRTVRDQARENELIALNMAEMKQRFLADMSHEIRTPLNGVTAALDIALSEESIESMREYVQVARSSSTLLLSLVSNLLDLSKLEAGQFDLTLNQIDLRVVLEHVANTLMAQAIEKEVQFSTMIGEEVPPTLFVDEKRICQILTNLLSNAIKFTPAGGEVSLEVHMTKQQGTVGTFEFCVRDNGIGISDEDMQHIFSAYKQASSDTAGRCGGTGLGLSIAKSLINKMGSEPVVSSEIGQGTVVRFAVDLEYSQDATCSATSRSADDDLDIKAKILLVEDNVVNQKIAARILERRGATVVVAADGESAIETFQNEKFDLVLMDCNLPAMNGIEATEKIRALESHEDRIPIIAVTASATVKNRDDCLSAGMNDFLTKPFTKVSLLSLVREHLEAQD